MRRLRKFCRDSIVALFELHLVLIVTVALAFEVYVFVRFLYQHLP
jgi:hypothetical protein